MKENAMGKIPSIKKIHFQALQPFTPSKFLLIPYDSNPLKAPARVDVEKKMAARVASSWYSYQKERSVRQICFSISSLNSQNIAAWWETRTKCAALNEGLGGTNEKSHGYQLTTGLNQYREHCKKTPLHIMNETVSYRLFWGLGKVSRYC